MKFEDVAFGWVLGFMMATLLVAFLFQPPGALQKVAVLPYQCQPGTRALMTTAATAEYFECEGKWVRK